MTKLIKRRIVPFLLLLVLCIGMVPTAFADAEITVTDNAASDSTTQEDSQHNADIVVVPNEESEDLFPNRFSQVLIPVHRSQPAPIPAAVLPKAFLSQQAVVQLLPQT